MGFLGVGVSFVLFMLALRHLGAGRTGAYFSLAPFIGAVLAVLLFREPLTAQLLMAGALMALGLWLHLAERHDHEHAHEVLEHEHAHVHDEHHRHVHASDVAKAESHSHWHRHEPCAIGIPTSRTCATGMATWPDSRSPGAHVDSRTPPSASSVARGPRRDRPVRLWPEHRVPPPSRRGRRHACP